MPDDNMQNDDQQDDSMQGDDMQSDGDDGDMTVKEAGEKGGQKVRRLVKEGEEMEEGQTGGQMGDEEMGDEEESKNDDDKNM